MPTTADYPSYTSGGPCVAIPSHPYTLSSGVYLAALADPISTCKSSLNVTQPGRHSRGTILCLGSPEISQTSMGFSTTPAPVANPLSLLRPPTLTLAKDKTERSYHQPERPVALAVLNFLFRRQLPSSHPYV